MSDRNRTLGLFQSSVLNMIDMVGIGPFIVMPVVINLVGGMYLWAWVAGAVLAFLDAMIWSELGTSFPLAGGSYYFLKESYGPNGAGKMMSFLFVWQTIIQAPLVAASAAIGFSQYFMYLVPLEIWQQKALSGAVIIFITFLLYRKVESIGKIGVLLWAGVIGTMGWIIFAGVSHGNFLQPLAEMKGNFSLKIIASFIFGQACVKTIYSYLGYYNICHLGGDIKDPGKNIPRSMFISVIVIAVLYLAMNMSITSVIPWQEIQGLKNPDSHPLISAFIEKLYGHTAAIVITVMVLWVALASLFAVMLGYSRVPFAAARDGAFFKIFAKLHPTKNFPYISLLILAACAFVFSLLFRMGEVISAILAMRIIVQFIGQAAGLILLRNRKAEKVNIPFKMPFYPLPLILAVIIWLFVFCATGLKIMLLFGVVLLSGIAVYMIKSKLKKEWPFNKAGG